MKKPQLSLDALVFSTPEQKVLRLLLAEPTTSFTPRVIASRLKGVRGLGGAEGIIKILGELEALGLVDFVDHRRSARIQDESPSIQVLKTLSSLCDLETLRRVLEPMSVRGILHGSRARGKSRSGSNYNLYVVSETPDEVLKAAERHPLGRDLDVTVATPEAYGDLGRCDPSLLRRLEQGVGLWGSGW